MKREESMEQLDEDGFSFQDLAAEDYLALAVFWLLAIDVFAQFFSRYVIQDSISWTEEIARYLLITLTFVGSARAVRKRNHISIEMFYTYLPDVFKKILYFFISFGCTLFFLFMVYLCWEVAQRTYGTMVALPIPKRVIYYIVMLGFSLMAVRSIAMLLKKT